MAEGSTYRGELRRMLESGEHLYAEELMNIILKNAFHGQDFTPLCKRLMSTFPSVRAVMESSYAELLCVPDMPKPVAKYLVTLGRLHEEMLLNITHIDDTEDFIAQSFERLENKSCEHAELYFVNRNGKVTGKTIYTSDLADRVSFSFRDIISQIISHESYGFYLVHNHTHSEAVPSPDDDECTCRLLVGCRGMKTRFLDHCIIGVRKTSFSYRKSGRFDELLANPDKYVKRFW